ncbi:glycosyltransferase [Salegentibacter sediminis]|uniref:glycosyltransferase n=1 Tax=Salegentibacter sediminis TaxID=1930251 RepID=UPI0012FFAE73|nr:glycosyltransferase [Salegentibacter sediminis]
MKIAHVVFSLLTGGTETMLVDLLNEQTKSNAVMLFVINDKYHNYLLDEVDKRVKIVRFNRKEKSKNFLAFLKLNSMLFLFKPHLVHCHHQSIIEVLLNRRNVILTLHCNHTSLRNLHKYKKVVAISETVKNNLNRKSSIISEMIYNGIDISRLEKKKNFSFTKFKIVQVSRLHHAVKGQHILIKALNILVHDKKIRDIHVDFIGEGPSEEYLKNLTTEYNLQSFVNFLGIRDRGYIYSHLKDYELLIQPSLDEGFGLTIAEGLIAKVPVLVSNINAPMELIENGVYGNFFEVNNENSCAARIEDIIKNYEFQVERTEKSSLYASNKFDIRNTAVQYIDLSDG